MTMKETKHLNSSIQIIILFLILGISIVSAISCKKESGNGEPKDLIYTEPQKILIEEGIEKKIRLFVNSDRSLAWQLSYSSPIVNIEPKSGFIDKKGIELTITSGQTGLPEGKHNLSISFIISGAGVFETSAEINVPPKYFYSFLQDSVVFHQNEKTKYVTIINLGNSNMLPSLDINKSWMSYSFDYYYLKPNTLDKVRLDVEKRMVKKGWNVADIIITPNNPIVPPLKVHYFVEPFSLLESSVHQINLDRKYETQFYLINAGTELIDWTLENKNEVLNVSPSAGSLASGDSALIQVNAIEPITDYGIYEGDIIVSFEGNTTPLQIKTKLNHYEIIEKSYHNDLVDALFNPETNEIIAITRNENEIKLINPETNSIRKTNLHAVPIGLCLFNNGQQIAVTFKGSMQIFNYQNLENIKTIQFNDFLRPYCILERNDGNLLINFSNYTELYLINTQDWSIIEIQTNYFYDFQDNNIVSNPAFEALYLIKGIQLYQLNLSDTTIIFGKTVFIGDYCDKAFVSPDGTSIISDNGNKYSLSPNQDHNLILTDEIPTAKMEHLTFFNNNNQIAWIIKNQNSHVRISGIQSYSDQHIIILPYLSFMYNASHILIIPSGRKVFVSKDENKLYSIASYYHTIQGHHKWGIHVSNTPD